MKKIALLLLSLFLLTACTAEESAGDSVALERGIPETTMNLEAPMMEIMNFRTSDALDMVSENRIIRTYEEFKEYNQDYAILENPFFIDDLSLNKLQKVDESYFDRVGVVAVILVESSGSNSVVGENLVINDNIAEAFINRTVAEIGTMDIATRHVLFAVSQEELENVEEVKVTISLK
ncbi:MAG TPA: hypothetical protein VLM88_12380 [Proteiniclasticum sp.]|nr:hypothetical protein [Proteiniclasticum sp.]